MPKRRKKRGSSKPSTKPSGSVADPPTNSLDESSLPHRAAGEPADETSLPHRAASELADENPSLPHRAAGELADEKPSLPHRAAGKQANENPSFPHRAAGELADEKPNLPHRAAGKKADENPSIPHRAADELVDEKPSLPLSGRDAGEPASSKSSPSHSIGEDNKKHEPNTPLHRSSNEVTDDKSSIAISQKQDLSEETQSGETASQPVDDKSSIPLLSAASILPLLASSLPVQPNADRKIRPLHFFYETRSTFYRVHDDFITEIAATVESNTMTTTLPDFTSSVARPMSHQGI